jgi:uncharacterized protein (TIGR00255 family)
MYSMSGFGSYRCAREGYEISIEIKTVNHRYFDFNARMPKNLNKFEEDIRKCVQGHIARGRVDVFVSFANRHPGAKRVILDETLLDAYLDKLREMGRIRKLKNDVTVMQMARLPEILSVEEEHDDEDFLRNLVTEAAEGALESLLHMRKAEGETISRDIVSRLETVAQLADRAGARVSAVRDEYAEKLRARIAEILRETVVDEARLSAEVAFYADRCDITEEVVRLKSHIAQLRKLLASDEPQGRKADFLTQELHRETNTMGSKSADTIIAEAVIEAKAEIEKIREQVQNLE